MTRRIVKRAASEVSGDSRRPLRRALPLGLAAVAAIAAVFLVRSELPLPATTADANQPPATAADTAADSAVPEDAPPAGDEQAGPPSGAVTTAPPPDHERNDSATPSLADDLAEFSAPVDEAMQTLLQLWGGSFSRGAASGCEQASSQGLSCLYQRGSWAVVRQLNRPAMLTLTDTDGVNHHPVVTAIDGERVELAFGGQRRTYDEDDVASMWFGQYLLLWRPPNGSVTALAPGARGANVVWLRDSLALLDPALATSGSEPDYFDAELEQRLREFQRRNRLVVDGLAGQQTQILINSLLAAENTPRLAGGPR